MINCDLYTGKDLQVVKCKNIYIFLALNVLLRNPELFKHPVTDVILAEYNSLLENQQCKHNRLNEKFSLEFWGIPVQRNSHQ